MDDRVAWKIEPKEEFKGHFDEVMDSNENLCPRIVGSKNAGGICFYSPFLLLFSFSLFCLFCPWNWTWHLPHPLSTLLQGLKTIESSFKTSTPNMNHDLFVTQDIVKFRQASEIQLTFQLFPFLNWCKCMPLVLQCLLCLLDYTLINCIHLKTCPTQPSLE